MSYGLRYSIPFLNRELVQCEVQLLSNDSYAGGVFVLEGAENPFVLSAQAQDSQIPYGIRATAADIDFFAGNDSKALYYSGNDDIDFHAAGNKITILHQLSDLGVRPGMQIMVLGILYNITNVFYSATLTDLELTVSEIITDNFINDTDFFIYQPVNLKTFYNEDDTFWRVVFLYNSVVAWTGFLQLVNCSESITDTEHTIQLNADDGLSRLQTQYFLNTDGTPRENPQIVQDFFGYCLQSVGADIGADAWLNIFENSTDDRSVASTKDFLQQTVITNKYFLNDDGTTQTVYDGFNKFLTDLRCSLFQAKGVWQVIRWSDVRLFTDGTMPGTHYSTAFAISSAITFTAAIKIGRGLAVHPINENQQSKILRPFQYSKETFNYVPYNPISQSTMQLPAGAVPFQTNTIGTTRYDDYDLATYFPYWVQRNGDGSYLEILTDTATGLELDRYIFTPDNLNQISGVQFNPFPVSKNDAFNLSFSYQLADATPLSGTVEVNSGSSIVLGTGTSFTTDFNNGDLIKIADTNEVHIIQLIGNDTTLTTTANFDISATGSAYSKVPSNAVMQNFFIRCILLLSNSTYYTLQQQTLPQNGTVSVIAGSKIVSGTGTNFTTVFQPGDAIKVADTGEVHIVQLVGSDTVLTVTSNFIISATNSAWSKIAIVPTPGQQSEIGWTGPFNTDTWDDTAGIYAVNSLRVSDWINFNLSDFISIFSNNLLFPVDGVLLIQIEGNNGGDGYGEYSAKWKDINCSLANYVNKSFQITGQTSNTQQLISSNYNLQRDATFEDSPRKSISGSLFTNATENFDYTDTITGEATGVGDVYTTLTSSWHRAAITESRKLGDLNTNGDVFIQRIVREIIEGDFYGLTNVSLLSLINFDFAGDRLFIIGVGSFNYMTCIWNATIYELFDESESDASLMSDYLFNYIYNTNQ